MKNYCKNTYLVLNFLLQVVCNSKCFNLQCFVFTMVQKQHTFSRPYFRFWTWSSPGLETSETVLSEMLCSSCELQISASHTTMRCNNQPSTVNSAVSIRGAQVFNRLREIFTVYYKIGFMADDCVQVQTDLSVLSTLRWARLSYNV
jgi:hypothetical protein